MKVFLSHQMSGMDTSKVMAIRNQAIHYLTEKFSNTFIEIIDNYHHDEIPEGSPSEFYLAKSIEQMVHADAIYFCKGWENARGCRIERVICDSYATLKYKVIETEEEEENESN